MDIATTGAIERVARVLAAQRLSANADGGDAHAANAVDDVWREFEADAMAILKTLREPDEDGACRRYRGVAKDDCGSVE